MRGFSAQFVQINQINIGDGEELSAAALGSSRLLVLWKGLQIQVDSAGSAGETMDVRKFDRAGWLGAGIPECAMPLLASVAMRHQKAKAIKSVVDICCIAALRFAWTCLLIRPIT